jgi:membrane protease YdiL (CAAX protease family)
VSGSNHESGVKFGPWQGLWLLAGYLVGQTLAAFGWGVSEGFQAALRHRPVPQPSPMVMAWETLAGFLLSSAWVVFYTRRRARPLLRRGGAEGIAWRAPKLQAYGVAVLAALLAMLFSGLMFDLFPPDLDKLTGPTSKMLAAPGLPRFTVMFLAMVGAPLMEEFTFRGALFASLARRWSVPLAGTITTLIYVALHAPDKLGWWPGFVAVGFLGALLLLLRLRYKSLWPGILAHCLYNSSFFFLS